MDCCIYILYWDIDKPYIGQTSRDIKYRRSSHYNAIVRGDHCNYKILEEYYSYGVLPNIEVLYRCTEAELDKLEEQFIVEFDSINNGLNIISGGYSVGRGVNNSCSKYDRDSLIQCFNMLSDITIPFKQITSITGIPRHTITKISTGVQHNWLHEEFPEIWNKIQSISTKSRYTASACAAAQGKKYRRIMSPEGVVYEVTNTLAFSKEHNIPNGNLCSVLLGNRNTVKGWKGVD